MSQVELAPSNRLEILDEGLKRHTLHRRFDRMARLVGDSAMEKLFRARVVVVGLGGVGSFAAESLARSGVGHLTLVDFDEICVTNTNRQLHALAGRIGEKKAHVVAERLGKVNPQAKILALDKFYSKETAEEILGDKPDLVLDCIDNLTAKCNLLATCRERGISVIASGGASAKEDPLKIKFADLSETHTDPFIHEVRRILRQKYGFASDGPMGIPTVFSDERPSRPFELGYDKGTGFRCVCPQGNDLHSCEKRAVIYGTASYVTGAFGLVMAARAVSLLKA